MDQYTLVILAAFLGFLALSVALLLPVYFFLKKEERLAEAWTQESISARAGETSSSLPGQNPGPVEASREAEAGGPPSPDAPIETASR